MDEKDRHIITFDGDEPTSGDNSVSDKSGIVSENNFTYTTDIHKPGSSEPKEVAGDSFVMRPSEPVAEEPKPVELNTEPTFRQSEPSIFSATEPSYGASETEFRTEAPKADTTVEPDYMARRMASDGPAHVKPMPVKEKRYVTKGTLVACMIVTMLVSAILGALMGEAFSGNTNTSQGSNGVARNDSKLTELDLSEATGSKLTVGQIINKNADAVVEIIVEGTTEGMWGQMQLTQGAGSGVIVKENGYIATNYHVVQGAKKVEVTLHNGDKYNATIVGTDPSNDIAVIKIDAKGLTTATIGDSSKVQVGDLAVAIGNPLGQLGGTATSGIISALDRTLTIEGTTLTLLQTDAAINGGNSGGGLFNGSGELIGIVESKASAVGVEGLAFALPINSVSEIINDMIANGGSAKSAASSTPAVGVVISEVSEENAQYYGLDSAGVYIAQVTGTNAIKAGFQEQDRIVSIDGKTVTSTTEFISLVRKHKVGDTVTIVVSRNGQEIEIKSELEPLENTQE